MYELEVSEEKIYDAVPVEIVHHCINTFN